MSFVETSMSVRRIWGFDDDAELRMARAAGWSRADLVWERLTEAAHSAYTSGDLRRTWRLLTTADWLARFFFERGDLRSANTATNLAFLALRRHRPRRAAALRARALAFWSCADEVIETLEFRPRSRSSLFHLRMEALHRDQFHANMRTRYRRIAEETEAVLRASEPGTTGGRPMFSRWRGEKPPVFDDSRKFLAAALALIEG